jgi:hypothetical protein
MLHSSIDAKTASVMYKITPVLDSIFWITCERTYDNTMNMTLVAIRVAIRVKITFVVVHIGDEKVTNLAKNPIAVRISSVAMTVEITPFTVT